MEPRPKSPNASALNFLKSYGEATLIRERLRYVPIHIFADDWERLERFDLQLSDCFGVDSWCVMENGVAFISMFHTAKTRGAPEVSSPGVSYSPRKKSGVRVHDFYIRTDASITKAVYEKTLVCLFEWYQANRKSLPIRRSIIFDCDLPLSLDNQ